ARPSRASEAISAFARAFQKAATRECQSNDARSQKPMSMRNAVRFLPTLCSWPSARSRGHHIPSAPSSRARRYDRVHRSRYAVCPPADRFPQGRALRSKICGVRCAFHPTRLAAPLEYADKASPNPKRNVPEKVPSQSRAPAAPQKAVPQPAEFLSVAARRVCSFNSRSQKSERRIVAVGVGLSNHALRFHLNIQPSLILKTWMLEDWNLELSA